jgi:hypothetical protein
VWDASHSVVGCLLGPLAVLNVEHHKVDPVVQTARPGVGVQVLDMVGNTMSDVKVTVQGAVLLRQSVSQSVSQSCTCRHMPAPLHTRLGQGTGTPHTCMEQLRGLLCQPLTKFCSGCCEGFTYQSA